VRHLTTEDPNQLIYDWNRNSDAPRAARGVAVLDDTLRDGLQNASVRMPGLEARRAIIEQAVKLGIDCVNLGLPSASERAFAETVELCRFIVERALPVRVACAGRTLPADMKRIVEVVEHSGLRVEAHCFVGSSPLRLRAEGWSPTDLERWIAESLAPVTRAGLEPTFVTEDTTRSTRELLSRLFAAALAHGATRLCLCDTVGHATPDGTRRLVAFAREIAERAGGGIRLDWHGHNDRGLALANALAAVSEGVDRVHATAFGIGERVGNTPLELLVLNLELEGRWHHDVRALVGYAKTLAKALDWPIPRNYPLLGENAFRTATGVHAAAIAKARSHSAELSDLIYSAVPAAHFGRSQEISVGYMSGSSNVLAWLERMAITPSKDLVDYILHRAKQSDHILSDDELSEFVRDHRLKIQR
jgi:2-isopropylmalate synthase